MAQVVEKAKDAMHLNKNKDIKIAGLPVHSTGYGLMGLTWRANPPPQEQAFEAMSMFSTRFDLDTLLTNHTETALDNGANFWNGGELYGNPERNSLHLLNEYFTKYPKDCES